MLRRQKSACLALIGLIFFGFSSLAAAQTPPANPNYQVFAFNDLGMHCYDQDFSVFCLLPPFNTIHGQVVQKGIKPTVLSDSQAALTYRGVADPSGSINTTSIGKTNFWNYMLKLFGLSQPPDTGILGYKMPSATLGPQPLAPYDSTYKWFSATGIPLTNLDDSLRINAFPMMKIQATDNLVSTWSTSLNIVAPVSNEMNCVACHETAAFVDINPGSASDASPPPRLTTLDPTQFSYRFDTNVRVRENILILHDAFNGTTLFNNYFNGNPILCASCHYSKALDLAGAGPQGSQVGHTYLSRAMHKHHGTAWPMMDVMGTYTVPIPGTGVTQCYYCHPGNDTQCLRSVMAVQGMQCQNCHGEMLQVGGFTMQLGQPGFVDPYLPNVPDQPALRVNLTSTGQQRQPWVDMPKCQACHSGDVLNHLGPNLIGMQAFDPADPAATPLSAANQRFAENPGQIYRFSSGHGGLACESCHGSTHAEWPAKINSNDNLTATQIQGHTGEIAECGACHAPQLSPSLNGPHGLHNVNNPLWMNQHGIFLRRNRNTCKACHGQDLQGTALSRAKFNRNLPKSQSLGGSVTFATGAPVSCYACHTTINFGGNMAVVNLLLNYDE